MLSGACRTCGANILKCVCNEHEKRIIYIMVKKRLTDLAANKGLVKKHGFTSPPQSVTGVKMLGYETRARVLEAGAKVLEQEIDAMRRDAARLRARATQKQQEKERRNIWKKVATYMDAGLSRDRAIGTVASTFAATTADPDAHVRYWCGLGREEPHRVLTLAP